MCSLLYPHTRLDSPILVPIRSEYFFVFCDLLLPGEKIHHFRIL
jgi:hypothetical protein